MSMLNVRTVSWIGAAVLAVSAIACGGNKYATVTIPPRLELGQYERAALASFTVENAKGSLHELATRRFSEHVLAASRDVEVLELGSTAPVLQKVGESQFGPEAAKAIGVSHDVPVVFGGHLKVSNAKPSGGIGGFGIPHVEATVTVELTVGLYSTKTGGTLWRSGAAASEKVGQLSVVGGVPSFSAKDPNAAYGRLVDQLISAVTRDLYPTYERRRVS
jgi:hypothetical protein